MVASRPGRGGRCGYRGVIGRVVVTGGWAMSERWRAVGGNDSSNRSRQQERQTWAAWLGLLDGLGKGMGGSGWEAARCMVEEEDEGEDKVGREGGI